MPDLTHIDEAGNARMVDVGAKEITVRSATAEATVLLTPAAFDALVAGTLKKGDALGVARVAGIMAAKRTDELIPLCHPLAISGATVNFELLAARTAVRVEATVTITGRTGVEMEALVAASTAALTIYDMCKAIDKGITIEQVRLLHKEGGASGEWIVDRF